MLRARLGSSTVTFSGLADTNSLLSDLAELTVVVADAIVGLSVGSSVVVVTFMGLSVVGARVVALTVVTVVVTVVISGVVVVVS